MSWLRRLYFRLIYLRQPPWDTNETPPELLEFIATHPPGRALDLGCGTGTNAITLARHGWQVTGVDFVGRALDEAKKKARAAGVSVDFLADDVTRLRKVSGYFDLVLDIGCFHSLSASGKLNYVQNLERLTAPEGYYLLYGFLPGAENSGPGIQETDIKAFEMNFISVNREEGTDRGQRPSVWLIYQRKLEIN